MNHPEVTRSQADTLDAWAGDWERDAHAKMLGAAEVAFQLRRTARLIRRTVDPWVPRPDVDAPPSVPTTEEVRDG